MADDGPIALVPTALPAGPDEIVREIRIAAAPEIVFSYFTDPQKIVLWQGVSAELDPRPGGLFRVTFGSGFSVRGAYVDVVPPRRVVYTWGWEAAGAALPPGASTVEATLEPSGTGTLLRIHHRGLPLEIFELHASGWDESLTELARTLARS